MKLFLALSAILALSDAAPSILLRTVEPLTATAPLISQYHSQDSLGQYAYGYGNALSAKHEAKSIDGVTRGNYAYIDPQGNVQTVAYTADSWNGFRVAATNLPEAPKDLSEPVKDTPEVEKARAEHLTLIQQGGVGVELAEPVKETPEVALARSEHLAAIERAKSAELIDIKLEPVKETPEVALARSEHLKAVEVAKTRNAIIEAIDNKPVKIISPTLITPTANVRLALAEPAIRVAALYDINEVKLEAPVTKVDTLVAPSANVRLALTDSTIRLQPEVTRFATLNGINEIKLEAPVTKLEKIETPILRIAAPAEYAAYAPYGFAYNNLVGAPLTYTFDSTRLIRSAQ